MSPQAEAVTSRLRKTWVRWWTFSVWSGVVLAASVSLATLVLFVLADALLKLPQRVLGTLFAVWAVAEPADRVADLVRQRTGRRSLAATARRVELAFPELESHLINIVQFAERDGVETTRSARRPMAQAAAAVADFPFDQAAAKEEPLAAVLALHADPARPAGVVLLLGGSARTRAAPERDVPAWASSTRRVLHPFSFVPSVGSVKIVKVTPGDAEVLIGSSLQISAEIENPAEAVARDALRPPGERSPSRRSRCSPTRRNVTYLAALSQVLTPLRTGSRSATPRRRSTR